MNLFTKFDVDQMVIFNMISVHEDYGGQGIGRKLAQLSEDHLRKNNKEVRIISAETTGALSAKIFQRQGFEQITFINYDKYVDKNNKLVFQNMPAPHTACVVWAKSI